MAPSNVFLHLNDLKLVNGNVSVEINILARKTILWSSLNRNIVKRPLGGKNVEISPSRAFHTIRLV